MRPFVAGGCGQKFNAFIWRGTNLGGRVATPLNQAHVTRGLLISLRCPPIIYAAHVTAWALAHAYEKMIN